MTQEHKCLMRPDNLEGSSVFHVGNSGGAYEFPDREIEGSVEWKALRSVLGLDYRGYTAKGSPHRGADGGYDDGHIVIHPYYWGDDYEKQCLPNYRDNDCGLEINWYKYPFRDAYMNWKMTAVDLRRYFAAVALKYMAEGAEDSW